MQPQEGGAPRGGEGMLCPPRCLRELRLVLGRTSAEYSHCSCPHSIDTDQNRYPQKLAVAECLCRGCINAKTGRETAALNSVQLLQSLLVLRRQPCSQDGAADPTPGSFTFHTEFIRVPVGCTCVLPRSAQ